MFPVYKTILNTLNMTACNADQEANVALLGESRAPNIIRRHTAFAGGPDTTSRFELISLNGLQSGRITVSSDYALYSDATGLQIAFLGFGLLNTMNNVVGFNVGRSGVTSTAGTIRYDQVNEDTHTAFNVSTGQYVVPVSGPYVLAITASPLSNSTFAITLYSGSSLITTLYMYDTTHNDVDTLGTTALVNLNQDDRITTSLSLGPLYSDIRYTTSFQGFLYAPTGIIPLSWSVANEQTYTGLVDPVPFDVVFINQGNGWDIVDNRYRVRDAGVFYIQMTAGLAAGYPTRMELLLNGSPQSSIYRQSNVHNGVDTRTRAMILRLVTDDELRIRLPAGNRLYSNANRVTKFSGFRIYA